METDTTVLVFGLFSASNRWSDDIGTANYSGHTEMCFFPSVYWVSAPFDVSLSGTCGRMVLMEDGQTGTPDVIRYVDCRMWTGSQHGCPVFASTHWIEMDLFGTAEELQEEPCLRRDRYWQRVPLTGGTNFIVLIGNTEYDLSVSYTNGTSTTETESFGRSITATSGVDFGALSASVSVTLSQTFESSVTINSESTIAEVFKAR